MSPSPNHHMYEPSLPQRQQNSNSDDDRDYHFSSGDVESHAVNATPISDSQQNETTHNSSSDLNAT